MSDVAGLLVLLGVALVLLTALLSALIAHGMRRPPRHTAAYALVRGLPIDPDELGLRWTHWKLERPGATLPVWEIDLRGGEGDGGERDLTAVLLHGWGQSRVDLLAWIEPWRRCCTRLVLYDLRGHGDAEGEPSRLGAGEDDDLLALLEQLGPGRVLLGGYSLGAAIAIAAAAKLGDRSGERLAGVIAWAPYARFATAAAGRLRQMRLPARPFSDIALAALALRGIRPRTVVEDAAKLRCPLLVIYGSSDEVVPISEAEAVSRAAPVSTWCVVDGAGHLDLYRAGHEAQERAIEGFVEAVKVESRK